MLFAHSRVFDQLNAPENFTEGINSSCDLAVASLRVSSRELSTIYLEFLGVASRLQTTARCLTAVDVNCDTVTGFIPICASKRGLVLPLGHHTRDGVSLVTRTEGREGAEGLTFSLHPRHGPPGGKARRSMTAQDNWPPD